MIEFNLKDQEEKLASARIRIIGNSKIVSNVSLAAPVEEIDARIDVLLEAINDFCTARLTIGILKRKEQREKWKQEMEERKQTQ